MTSQNPDARPVIAELLTTCETCDAETDVGKVAAPFPPGLVDGGGGVVGALEALALLGNVGFGQTSERLALPHAEGEESRIRQLNCTFLFLVKLPSYN